MKKLACIMLSVIMLLSLAACGSDDGPDEYRQADEPVISESIEYNEPANTLPEKLPAAETVPEPDVQPTLQPDLTPESTPEPASQQSDADTPTPGKDRPAKDGAVVTIPLPETEGNLVWIPVHGGTKYHTHSGCSDMREPIQVSKETAVKNGFTACKRCYG